jgi:hypothetical protein
MSTKKKEPNYRALFVVGLSFTGAGTSLMAAGLEATGIALLALGVVFFIVGISNRKKMSDPYCAKNHQN